MMNLYEIIYDEEIGSGLMNYGCVAYLETGSFSLAEDIFRGYMKTRVNIGGGGEKYQNGYLIHSIKRSPGTLIREQ